jgi:replication fork clamp-binding protein CrfC
VGSEPIQSFDFIKTKVKKHISSSMLPIIYTMANSTSFTYFRKLKESIQNFVTRCHILVKGFKSKGGAINAIAFYFIVSLNMPY